MTGACKERYQGQREAELVDGQEELDGACKERYQGQREADLVDGQEELDDRHLQGTIPGTA
jgi:hypothetical protein